MQLYQGGGATNEYNTGGANWLVMWKVFCKGCESAEWTISSPSENQIWVFRTQRRKSVFTIYYIRIIRESVDKAFNILEVFTLIQRQRQIQEGCWEAKIGL